MISVRDLCKVYGDTQVLHGLTFDVQPGRLVGLLGPNGSGKSTTLDILGGLLGPTDGVVTVCGFDVVSQSLEAKSKISYLRDNPGLYQDGEVQEFIEYMAALRGLSRSDRRRAANRVIDECEIGHVRNRIIGHLSKGYRQRVALAASMVHQPEVMILDEPTDGLDPTQIFLFRKLVKNLAKERAVMLSSHILSEVQAVCSDVLIIQKGHLAYQGSLTDLDDNQRTYVLVSGDSSDQILTWLGQQTDVESSSLKSKGVFHLSFVNNKDQVEKQVSRLLEKFLSKGFSLNEFFCEKKSLETIYLETLSLEKDHLNQHKQTGEDSEAQSKIENKEELSNKAFLNSNQEVQHETRN
jgi:ABC-2 type transport system ATP-binding protein